MNHIINDNGINREMTAEEEAQYLADIEAAEELEVTT